MIAPFGSGRCCAAEWTRLLATVLGLPDADDHRRDVLHGVAEFGQPHQECTLATG